MGTFPYIGTHLCTQVYQNASIQEVNSQLKVIQVHTTDLDRNGNQHSKSAQKLLRLLHCLTLHGPNIIVSSSYFNILLYLYIFNFKARLYVYELPNILQA